MGLPIFESKALFDRVADGEEIEVDGDEGKIVPAASGGDPIRVQPIPPFMQELIEDGGLMKHIAKGGRKPA